MSERVRRAGARLDERIDGRGSRPRTGRGGITLAVLTILVALTGASRHARAEVTADCEFLEISAKVGDKPAIDAELAPVEKKLKKPPFSTWNQFKLLSRSHKSLAKKKIEPISLKIGAATATLVEIVDKSKVRLTITMDDDKSKQVANNTTTVEAGDYMIYVHPLANNEGHLLSLTCK
jgi:hypothetical protein